MKKRIMGMISIFLMCTMLCSMPAFAVEARGSDQIKSCGASLSKSSDGQLYILMTISATGDMDVIGASSIIVQRYTGSDWQTEFTYTPQNTPDLQASGRAIHTVLLPYPGNTQQFTYRAIVNFYVKGPLGVSVATRVAQ